MTRRDPAPVATTETKPAKKRVTTDATLAASLFNRLDKLDAEEKAELAASPSDIAKKYSEKRGKLIEEASESVVALVQRMRGEP